MENVRPNIRIEIPNNVNEAMDIDNQESGENEEGEIQDCTDMNQCPESLNAFESKIFPITRTEGWMNEAGGFSTGIILNKETKEKLEERAKRFGLKPHEIQNFTEENLKMLHDSLGIGYINEKEIRFEAIHIKGTDGMSTEDVFEYFKKYRPISIEWVSDDSCNVVWEDKLSSARALYFTSKTIEGIPVEGPCNQFAKEIDISTETEEDETKGRSILLQNREIELQKEDLEDKENSTKCVHILDIKIPIPPGYWRLGLDHPKSKGIFMRFSFRSDKKPFKAEKFSEFYIKYGNPNYGLQGIISESKRRRMRGIFDRNKDIGQLQDNKNPWGILAKNWHEDLIFCEKEYKSDSVQTKRDPTDKTSIMNRLGFKRAHSEDKKEVEEEMAEKSKTSEYQKKKMKFPRMRMYADEEEEKLKHKKKKVPKFQTEEKPEENDLRKFLESGRKVSKRFADEMPIIDITDDLGDKIKSRFLKEARYSKNDQCPLQQKHTLRSDSILERKRPYVSPVRNLTPTLIERSRERQSRHHRHSNTYQHLHGGIHRNSKYLHSDVENLDYNRTQSKVAVVVKRQKKPTVASTIWTRIHNAQKSNRDRLRGKSASSSATSSGSESSSESTSSTSSSSQSSSSSESDESDNDTTHRFKQIKAEVHRPGFSHAASGHNHKSPLRIEIKNDRFKRK